MTSGFVWDELDYLTSILLTRRSSSGAPA